MISEPKTATQKLVTENPERSIERSHTTKPLSMTVKSPKVIIEIGRVSILITGLIVF